MALAALLVLALPMRLITTVEGQGADPRNTKPNTNPKNISPPRKPNAMPSSRPQNPNIELVKIIPPGSFAMGSTSGDEDEKPVHRVMINYTFYIGRYEVTQGQWQAVMGTNPSDFKNCGNNCPVDMVSWDEAKSFIRKLNQLNDGYHYRLPTEAEWEYACRAGTTGDYAGELEEMAWFQDNAGVRPHPVGSKRPNAWGLSDMYGNLYEWCEDWYHETYYGAPADGSAWSGGNENVRVRRGGSWRYPTSMLRSADRNAEVPWLHDRDTGFRVAAVARTK